MKLWWNGTIIDETEAVIPPNDHGFLYGIGLFETFRTYGGQPFLLARHIERLRSGCKELRIHYAPDEGEIRGAVADLLRINGLDEGYIRWSVSAGAAAHGLPSPAGYDRPNVLIMAKPLPAGSGMTEVAGTAGKELHVLRLPRSTPEGRRRAKSFHYMNNILAKWELAERTGSTQAEGLFTDGQGHAVEGIVSNVFWLRNGVLFTPSLATGCLPGVTREAVLELAKRLAIPVQEGAFFWEDIPAADAAFVTNSVQQISPVVRFFDAEGKLMKSWDSQDDGVLSRLSAAFQSWIKEDCHL